MSTCFDNIISFRGKCTDTTPTSGLWTDQIGLHKAEMEKYFTFPYESVDNFFDDQFNMALNDIKTQINSSFLPKYRSTSIIANARLGYTLDNMTLKTGSTNKYRGIEIETRAGNSNVEVFISELSLFLDTTGTVTIKVYDLNQNLMIDSFTVDAIANKIITVYPAKTYQTSRRKLNLAFVYDTTLYDSFETRISETSCGGCGHNSVYTAVNPYVNSRAIEIDSASDFILSSITNLSDTAGMGLIYSVNCNHKDWICSASNLLATPLLYKTAYNIVNYGLLASSRQNAKVNENTDKLKERIAYYDFKYLESMKDILQNMQPPKDPLCFECNDRIKTVFAM